MSSVKPPRILVFGAGAIGSFYGGLMAHAGYDVTLVARGDHLAVMRTAGAVTIDSFRMGRFIVPVTSRPTPEGRYDIIIIAVKSDDTRDAAQAIEPHLADDGFVVSFQNGVDNVPLLVEHFGSNRVVAASLFVGLRITPPGTVSHTAGGALTFGAWEPDGAACSKRFADVAEASGFDHTVSSNMKFVQWKKLLWNVGFNPLSALLLATCGKMVAHEGVRANMQTMVDEAAAAAAFDGVAIDDETRLGAIARTANLENYKTSMLQDIERGKAPEIDGILGPVIRRHRDNGSSAPACEMVYAALDFRMKNSYTLTPRLAVDMIIERDGKVLLVERAHPPAGWALPGGFVDYGETVETAAARELAEETGLSADEAGLRLLGVYSDPSRDARGHTASAVFMADATGKPVGGSDAARAEFHPLDGLPSPIAFDHAKIIEDYKKQR